MKTHALLMATASLSAITLLAAQNAGAQAVAKDTGKDTGIQEVIVTAQKHSTVASKTPIALTVLSADTLKDRGVTSAAALSNVAPSLEVGNAGQGVNISIRGVQTTDVSSKGEQSVAFSVDGVPIGRPVIIGTSFFDLARIEVLRGPQGTLYGKSSTGGAINVLTAQPSHRYEADASVDVGNYNARREEAMVNLPLSDTFAIRASVSANDRDGWLKPVLGANANGAEGNLNDENNVSGRIAAKWDYATNGSLIVRDSFGRLGGMGYDNDGVLWNRWLADKGTGSAVKDVYYNPMAGKVNQHYSLLNAELNQDFGAVHLTYVGAHLEFVGNGDKTPGTGDPYGNGGTPAYTWTLYRTDTTTDYHEVRLSNATPGKLEWVLGANYDKEVVPEDDMNWSTLASCAPSLSAACNSPNPVIAATTRHTSEGVFGQASYHLTDKLKLTGGLRYSKDEASRDGEIAAGGPPAAGWLDANGDPCGPPNVCVNGTPEHGRYSGGKVTWRVGADYQLAQNQLIYGSIATGYKPGSFNDVDPTKPGSGAAPYGAEQLTAYEIGYKGRLSSNFQLTSSAYYYDYSAFQLTGVTFLTPSATGGNPDVLIYTTLTPVKMYGFESDATWRPTTNDTVTFGLSLQRGYYSGHGTALVGFIFDHQIDLSGKTLDMLPKTTLRGGYEHVWSLGSDGGLTFNIDTKYSSGYVVTDTQGVASNPFGSVYDVLPQQYRQPSYTHTDLSLTYMLPDDKVQIQAYVHNLEDKMQLAGPPQHLNAPGVGSLDAETVRVSDPRMYGVRTSIKF